MAADLIKRKDGKLEEKLGSTWLAEYAEDPETGLWDAVVFKHDVAEWHGSGFATLAECRRAATEYYDQS